MKKKISIVLIIIFIMILLSVFIPVKKEKEWINDDEIGEVGHYEEYYYNLYGGNLTIFLNILLNFGK